MNSYSPASTHGAWLLLTRDEPIVLRAVREQIRVRGARESEPHCLARHALFEDELVISELDREHTKSGKPRARFGDRRAHSFSPFLRRQTLTLMRQLYHTCVSVFTKIRQTDNV